eukprot:gene23846-40381_t
MAASTPRPSLLLGASPFVLRGVADDECAAAAAARAVRSLAGPYMLIDQPADAHKRRHRGAMRSNVDPRDYPPRCAAVPVPSLVSNAELFDCAQREGDEPPLSDALSWASVFGSGMEMHTDRVHAHVSAVQLTGAKDLVFCPPAATGTGLDLLSEGGDGRCPHGCVHATIHPGDLGLAGLSSATWDERVALVLSPDVTPQRQRRFSDCARDPTAGRGGELNGRVVDDRALPFVGKYTGAPEDG